MRIAQVTDYSLRLLILAAARAPGMITVGEVADGYGRSRNHLTKVAHELGRVIGEGRKVATVGRS